MMLGGSSSSQGLVAPRFGERTGLPLVPCPACGDEIKELTCGQGSKVPGAIIFKCQLHDRDVPGSCPWYCFVDKYERMLIAKGLIEKSGSAEAVIRPDLAPLLEDVQSLKYGSVRVDEKLQKLIDLGKIAAMCLVVVAAFVIVGVIIMLVK